MKKFLMPFTLLLAVLVTVSSCTVEVEDPIVIPTVDMKGFYTGNVNTNSDLTILYVGALDLDTTFATLDATAEVSEHDHVDSLNLEVKMTLNGTPITVKVPAFKNSDNTLSITDHPYTYLIVNMIVNGSATLTGDDLTANLTLANGAGNPAGTIIEGDLTFVGAR
ncbi:MAG: hypothetical protein ACI8ZX_001430 [Planctomycetota bacterium]|jgi:hypothetical protein